MNKLNNKSQKILNIGMIILCLIALLNNMVTFNIMIVLKVFVLWMALTLINTKLGKLIRH